MVEEHTRLQNELRATQLRLSRIVSEKVMLEQKVRELSVASATLEKILQSGSLVV